MLRFNEFLIEQKNTHMTHVEELIFMKGVEGTRQAIEFLRDVRDALVSNSKSKVNITVKWDCLLYTSPSPRDLSTSRMPSSA